MFDRWNNAPWTARGLKFKSTVETVLGSAVVILVMSVLGWMDTY